MATPAYERPDPKRVAALVAGLVAGGLTVALLAKRKAAQLERRAEYLQAAASGDAVLLTELQRKAARMASDLTAFAEDYAEQKTRAEADRYMAEVYGLTPTRMQNLEALGRSLGV